jgi:short-subunit dehydrogenase
VTAPWRFEDCTAIVTGAASGIGLALARALAARGVDLALADRDEAALAAVRAELAAKGRRVVTHGCDVSDDAQVAEAARAFDRQLGPIHLLFNNAGIDMSGRLQDLALADWRRAFDVNVFGVVHGIRHFLPLLQRHGEAAHVVNTASGAGLWVSGDATMGAYAATKFAVVAISEALEQELEGTPVGVSVLCPGPVATAIAARSALASPQLLASIAAGTPPDEAAALALAGVERGDFWIFTPTRMRERLQRRHDRILAALDR